ncbi:MAG: patatin-like phospholipase family protein [Methylocella sp.]
MATAQIEAIAPSVGAYVPRLWQLKPSETLGLALSGGGFRASLFHIGVLARLAELDLLRHVNVLSTVSGGSIVGAYYYLKVKQLLEGERLDAVAGRVTPSSQAYVDIVTEIETEFLAAVQTNVRMQALLDPIANAKMIFSDDYSRSDRISEVYNERFYKKFAKNHDGKFRLPELLITPVGMRPGFNVKDYNRSADYKIPILNINATSLNTGSRWDFTAVDLGEVPPENPIGTIGVLPRLRYDDSGLTQKQRDKLGQITLAGAVAASACVPAIFTPFAIHDIYPPGRNGEEIVIELVDGGVYDNQGVDALLSEKCDYIICSDASGQLEENRTPSSQLLPVATRANDILMTRVRAECYDNLRVCPGDGKLVFFHLRDKFSGTRDFPPLPGPVDSSNGKDDGHVYALSNIRTDLDAFSDMEAYSLMYDGYCLSDYFLQHDENNAGLGAETPDGRPRAPWGFLSVRRIIKDEKETLLNHLKSGKYLFFKAFYLAPLAAFAVTLLLVAPVAALLRWNIDLLHKLYAIFIDDFLYYALLAVLIGGPIYAIVKVLDNTPMMMKAFDFIRQYRRADNKFLTWLFFVPGLVGTAVAVIHLFIYTQIFIRAGKLPSPKGP